jgi:glutamine synthetase adenylyltransferase
MPFDPAPLRALLAACAAALLVQALPARAPRLLDQALDLAAVPVAAKVPRRRA